jgi:4-hydroxy-4-methyl-2-oxoglutarate aldolase
MESNKKLSNSGMLELKRWNTPAIYNGWEQITQKDSARDFFNLEPVTDFMPHMGPMVGFAVTVVAEPSNHSHPKNNPDAWAAYREYVASIDGPKIVVVQDLDKPVMYGAFWGEVNSCIHKALGCVGTIVDGAIRDLDEMQDAGFKALARGLCVGHAKSWPVRWNCDVNVFGVQVRPGQLIHADKHGFLVIPEDDQQSLLEASRFMDANECQTLIAAAKNHHGKSTERLLKELNMATRQFNENALTRFGRIGEY